MNVTYRCRVLMLLLASDKGSVPEWPKGTGCKPVGLAYIGSNPIAPTISYAGVAQLVEHQPSKLRVAGSSLVSRSTAYIAQAVEHFLGKEEVTSSSLVVGSGIW